MNVLVVNAGSSSLKYQLFDTAKKLVVAKGLCEKIGIDGPQTIGALTHKNLLNGKEYHADLPMGDHTAAIQYVVDVLLHPEYGCVSSMSEIEAVGHRIVHGGAYFSESVLLTEDVLAKLELCRDLAPLHTGAHIQGIQGCQKVMPGTPQVLVFDTAFHQTMAPEAYMYGLPYETYEKYAIRRYGAHGTSHRYVTGRMLEILGRTENTKIVTCHLGNGSSISAVKDGKVVDTSMGFTPLAGVMMGTRCGDIDPAIVPFLMEKENLSPEEMSVRCFVGLPQYFRCHPAGKCARRADAEYVWLPDQEIHRCVCRSHERSGCHCIYSWDRRKYSFGKRAGLYGT